MTAYEIAYNFKRDHFPEMSPEQMNWLAQAIILFGIKEQNKIHDRMIEVLMSHRDVSL